MSRVFVSLAAGLAVVVVAESALWFEKSEAASRRQGAATPAPAIDVDVGIIDRSVSPCDDLYRYACGGWLASTSIPSDRPAWSRSFSEINERNLGSLRMVLERLGGGALAATPTEQKLADFYTTCMDQRQAERASSATLAEKMALVDALFSKGAPALARLAAYLHLAGVPAFFEFSSQQDFKNAREVIGEADQGGLGLPDRDYYLKTGAVSAAVREAYRSHVTKMLELAGVDAATAHADADAVVGIETELASASMSRTERRDPAHVYHRLDLPGLVRLAPHFDWRTYLRALGFPDIRAINVATPAFFARLDEVLGRSSRRDLEAYVRFHLIEAASPALGTGFVNEAFLFRARYLTGEIELLPRWKRCLGAVESGMGEALGRPFVAMNLGADGKAAALHLILAVEGAFRGDLDGLTWLDPATREQALQKLSLVYNQVGYPPRWRSFDGLSIGRSSDLENRMNATAFNLRYDLAKIGKPVDRADWSMSPQTVNAYYDPSKNEMVFPAGILQPPFFDVRAPLWINDGGIGAVMGHELTHGFDDEGRRFDGHGDLRDWWSPTVERQFDERVRCVVAQYDGYPILGSLHVNGALTAGENIADIGGLRMAWLVFRETEGSATSAPGSLTPAQRFFVAFAQSWCTKRRDEYVRTLATVDVHAPPQHRVNGAAANLPAFQEAFGCPVGAPMAPARRCDIW